MLSTTAQISIKSALEAMLKHKVLKMNKSSSHVANKKKNIFDIVVTPDRIPKFIIPSLDVDHVFLHVDLMEGIPEIKRELQRTQGNIDLSPRAKRSNSESNVKKTNLPRGRSLQRKTLELTSEELEKVDDHSDPPTRAALSLPHLPKITTPYGFLMLGESPNIRRKESLYFDLEISEAPPALSKRKKSFFTIGKPVSPLHKQQDRNDYPKPPNKPTRSISSEALCFGPSSLPFSMTSQECSAKCEKKMFSFWRKKQLPGAKCMTCVTERKERGQVTVGRTQSSPIS